MESEFWDFVFRKLSLIDRKIKLAQTDDMVATHVEIQTNLEQTKSMIRVKKETMYEKKNQIEKQNDKFKAHSANWRNFLVNSWKFRTCQSPSEYFSQARHWCFFRETFLPASYACKKALSSAKWRAFKAGLNCVHCNCCRELCSWVYSCRSAKMRLINWSTLSSP